MDRRDAMCTAAGYARAYVLWVVSVAASAVVGHLVQHALVQTATVAAFGVAGDPHAAYYAGLRIRAGDAWSYMLIGLLLVVVLVFLEHWYRTGVPSGRLLSRFVLATTVQLGVLSLAHGAYFVLARLAGVMPWHGVYVPALELAATTLCACLYRQRTGRRNGDE